jgi:hypothetical protein
MNDPNLFNLPRMETYTPPQPGQPDPLYHPEYVQLVRLTNKTVNPQASGLDPNQMMVFLLGGPMALLVNTPIANGNTALQPLGLGWAPDGPYAPAQSAQTKKGPFFDFPSERLVPSPAALNTNGLNHYVDPWGTPYAFFAATGDHYDPRVSFPMTRDPETTDDTLTYDPSDTADPNANGGKGPYTAHPYRSASKWLNAGKVQIISAGPNKQFGPGGAIVATAVANSAGLQLPPAGKLLYPYTPPNKQPGQYFTILWEPSQVGQHPFYNEKTRGEDDLCNFNAGANLGTSNAP